jgi:transcriptional regulator with XRE-family HTH domain
VNKTIHSEKSDRLRTLLREARENSGYTQQQLADLLKRPQSFVAKYELGERRVDVIEFLTIAKLLRADAAKIIKELGSI